jgi:hypothetical protein
MNNFALYSLARDKAQDAQRQRQNMHLWKILKEARARRSRSGTSRI